MTDSSVSQEPCATGSLRPPDDGAGALSDARRLYLELLKRTLLGMIFEDPPSQPAGIARWSTMQYVGKFREYGRDVPSQAHSMIGLKRMDNIQSCIERVLADGIPGDLIETGVWRGGATIFMRAMLMAFRVTDRTVWVADSFEGLPSPDVERYPADKSWVESAGSIAVSLETVRANFSRYGLLDKQVRFLKGLFRDTLPVAPIEKLAVLRMDGDLYESTCDALDNLYPRLSPGGFAIVDDYNFPSCRDAVTDYRERNRITEPIRDIDGLGVYWRKTSDRG